MANKCQGHTTSSCGHEPFCKRPGIRQILLIGMPLVLQADPQGTTDESGAPELSYDPAPFSDKEGFEGLVVLFLRLACSREDEHIFFHPGDLLHEGEQVLVVLAPVDA